MITQINVLYADITSSYSCLKATHEKDIVFHVEVFNEKNKIVNGGSVRLVFVDMKTNKTIGAPDFLFGSMLWAVLLL